MSEPFDAHAHFEQLAEQLIHFHEQLRKVVEHVGDDDIRTLIAECRREAHPQPGDSHNFEMPDWDGVAYQLESELHYRRAFRRATEHEAATRSKTYCPHCDGDCTPKHIAEMDDD